MDFFGIDTIDMLLIFGLSLLLMLAFCYLACGAYNFIKYVLDKVKDIIDEVNDHVED